MSPWRRFRTVYRAGRTVFGWTRLQSLAAAWANVRAARQK